MTRWVVKYNQWFNGSLSTAYVTVETERPDVHEALDAFERIGYVNARVLFVRMSRADEECGDALVNTPHFDARGRG